MTKRWQTARQARERLARTFPRCFAKPDGPKQPLKLDIHLDIKAVAPRFPIAEVMCGLRDYTSTPSYLQKCVEGAQRIDLNGSPAGLVTAAHAAFARHLFAKVSIRLLQKAKRQKRSGGASVPKRKSAPGGGDAARRQVAE